ncbi:MAG: hypothetical protein ACE5JN_05925 [Candidatus Methylomirabilia bacterium]
MRWLILLTFLAGVAVGVSGTLLAPRLTGSYLPEVIRGKTEPVEGEVVRKLKEEERVLLTVLTDDGAVLATFEQQVTQINLLVEEGDTVTLALRGYEPFVNDPAIQRVRKPKPRFPLEGSEPPPPPTGQREPDDKASR